MPLHSCSLGPWSSPSAYSKTTTPSPLFEVSTADYFPNHQRIKPVNANSKEGRGVAYHTKRMHATRIRTNEGMNAVGVRIPYTILFVSLTTQWATSLRRVINGPVTTRRNRRRVMLQPVKEWWCRRWKGQLGNTPDSSSPGVLFASNASKKKLKYSCKIVSISALYLKAWFSYFGIDVCNFSYQQTQAVSFICFITLSLQLFDTQDSTSHRQESTNILLSSHAPFLAIKLRVHSYLQSRPVWQRGSILTRLYRPGFEARIEFVSASSLLLMKPCKYNDCYAL